MTDVLDRTMRRAILVIASCTCACGSPTAPAQAYPDLSGTWSGNLTIIIPLPGTPPASVVCIHEWTIGSSTGGQISGTWHSIPDTGVPRVTPACEQAGRLSGTVTPSGAISVSFNAVLVAGDCSGVGGDAVFSGSLAFGLITASGQDTVRCPGSQNEPRTLSFSMLKR